jgi:Putative sensor
MNALSLRRDPVRLALSRGLWAGVWYLLAYQVVGWVLFAIVLGAVATGAVLSFTLAGLPVLVAAASVVRWCANVERTRLRTVDPETIAGRYREAAGPGVLAKVSTLWKDSATWRDVAYLLGMFVPLVTLDLVVLTIWVTFLAGITLPAWYWAPWQTINGTTFHGYELGVFPNGPHGHPAYGFYIDTLPKALLAAVIFLVLFLLFNYVLVATARLHAAAARGLLSAPEDPLREAKEVLRRPGPLRTFIPNGPY